MEDFGWTFMGMKFGYFMILLFVLIVALILYLSLHHRHPVKKVDKRAGDEGED